MDAMEQGRQAAQDRARACNAKPYATFDGGKVIGIACPLCGTPIAGMKRGQEKIERRNGKTIVVVPETYAYLPTHRRVMLFFENGGRHETHICSNCLPHLSLNQCEVLYCHDLAQWLWEEEQGLSKSRWDLLGPQKIKGFAI